MVPHSNRHQWIATLAARVSLRSRSRPSWSCKRPTQSFLDSCFRIWLLRSRNSLLLSHNKIRYLSPSTSHLSSRLPKRSSSLFSSPSSLLHRLSLPRQLTRLPSSKLRGRSLTLNLQLLSSKDRPTQLRKRALTPTNPLLTKTHHTSPTRKPQSSSPWLTATPTRPPSSSPWERPRGWDKVRSVARAVASPTNCQRFCRCSRPSTSRSSWTRTWRPGLTPRSLS